MKRLINKIMGLLVLVKLNSQCIIVVCHLRTLLHCHLSSCAPFRQTKHAIEAAQNVIENTAFIVFDSGIFNFWQNHHSWTSQLFLTDCKQAAQILKFKKLIKSIQSTSNNTYRHNMRTILRNVLLKCKLAFISGSKCANLLSKISRN